tara:strand:+ start:1656 stop:2117 length:462 start_codon:yes stop_codon:yes gene_type:complete
MRKIFFIFMFWSFLLSAQVDTITNSGAIKETSDWFVWFNWASFFMGLSIGAVLLYYSYHQRKSVKYTIQPSKTKKGADETEEAWGDFFRTFNEQDEAKKIYDKLRRKIHPDRFPNDEEKRDLATLLASELGDKKIHLEKLKEIEKKARESGLI